MMAPLRIAVIGAGIVGLSTAVQIQEALPSSQVTIIAEKFDIDTTSDGAAGTFQPASNLVAGVSRDVLKRWSIDSFNFYDKVAKSPEAGEAGVSIISGYQFFINDPKDEDPICGEICYQYRSCTDNEMKSFPGLEKAYHGVFYTTLMIEGRWFLPWLMKRFRKNGGIVVTKKLNNLEQLVGDFDLVANCTGLGSQQLVNDKEVVPVRGQVIRIKAPWIKHFFMIDGYDTYILPGKETVVVGGTRQAGNDNLNICSVDRDRIWRNACMYMPSIKNAKWEWEWVGLRPFRKPLRLETEILKFGNKSLPVVHNYGHGGNGIALAWGTAKHACQLVSSLAKTPSKL